MDPWSGLSHDPRLPEHAHLRSAAHDREAVAQVLAAAYAEGRITREELDERTDTLTASKTLGELPPLLADLVAAPPPQPWRGPSARSPAPTPEIRERAVAKYLRDRSSALWTLLAATLISVAVWLATGWDGEEGEFETGFPWPLFVLLGTGIHYVHVLTQRRQMIDDETRRLQAKERKRFERAERKRIERGERKRLE